jgi:hypothetical protein
MGLDVELEHGISDLQINVTNDNEMITGKIALAHLNEFPDYYTRLEKMEKVQRNFTIKIRKGITDANCLDSPIHWYETSQNSVLIVAKLLFIKA